MTFLSDATLDHLVRVADLPDTSGTRYEILDEIGRGGMGSVYVAHDPALDRRVALKVIHSRLSEETLRLRMEREARILARLEHPGIVPVHEVGRLADGRVYYTMKLVEGERLDHWTAGNRSLRERLRVLARMGEAVAFAHAKGVVHRDLKPANVMVGRFGEVLVMDWGVAKLTAEPELQSELSEASPNERATRPGAILGTPGYMSPEQAAGDIESIDERTDVFALGVMLEELSEDAEPGADKRLRAIQAKATRYDPEERYGTVEHLSNDIVRYLDGESVSAYAEGPFESLARGFRKYRAPILLLLAYLVARVILLVFFRT